MESIGYPFARLTEPIFSNISNAGWYAYQPVAGMISIVILLCIVAAYLLYYQLLKSVRFSSIGWWLSVGLAFAAIVGFFGFSQVKDLCITQNGCPLNPDPDDPYAVLITKSAQVGIMAAVVCICFYVLLSLIYPLRRYHRDIPFSPRNRR